MCHQDRTSLLLAENFSFLMKEQMLKDFLWNSDEWIREDWGQLGQLLREPGSAAAREQESSAARQE